MSSALTHREECFSEQKTLFVPNPSEITCKPLLKWPGGKRTELPLIGPRIPPHVRYFEPFFGGGSVYLAHIDAPAYVNDINSDLMTFYNAVKHETPSFFEVLYDWVQQWEQSTINGKAEIYYDARKQYNATSHKTIKRAVYFFLMRELAYGGMFRINSCGEFNVPFGKAYAKNEGLLRRKVDNLKSYSVKRKMNQIATMSTTDFATFISSFEFSNNDFMFVDPPYDTSFSTYGESTFDARDQERLAELLSSFPGKFMLVCKVTPMTEALYTTKTGKRAPRGGGRMLSRLRVQLSIPIQHKGQIFERYPPHVGDQLCLVEFLKESWCFQLCMSWNRRVGVPQPENLFLC